MSAQCAEFRALLPEYVAAGRPDEPDYGALRAHLAECPHCRAEAARLEVVERALRSWPMMTATPELASQVMAALADEPRETGESWQVLPWRVWVPAVTFTVALLVSVLITSVGAWPTAEQAEALISGWATAATTWLGTIRTGIDPNLFWALWSGIFATTAGLGISLCLRAWSEAEQEELNHLEEQAGEMADRVWGRLRGAH